MIRRFLWFAIALCACASLFVGGNALGQEPGVEFAVEPGPNSQTTPGGGYFVIAAEPGESVRQSLSLRNESNAPLTLQLAAVDGTTGQLGGVSYGLPDDPVGATGAWITLAETKVRLDVGEPRRVPFEVVVPEDASEGEHVAGIAVWATGTAEEGAKDDPVSVMVQTRRIMAVQVDLPGAKAPELVVTDLQAAARPDGLYLEIGIENRGTAMTTGEGTVEIPSEAFAADFAVDTFVPGTSIRYPLKWTDDPAEGEYEARVELEYEGTLTEWTGIFTVGDPVLADLEDRGVDVPHRLPIVPIAVAVGLAAAAAAVLWWIRRRRTPAHPAPATRSVPQRAYGSQPTAATPRPAASAPGGEPRTATAGPARPRYPTSGPPPPPPPPPPKPS